MSSQNTEFGIYKNIVKTDKKYRNTSKFLYRATCKICGTIVEKPLYELKNVTKCRHKKGHEINGYIEIFMPEHHLARSNGFVYEHMIKAEELLQRPLKKGEVVHHINEKRNDNDYNNLMVFRTAKDHSLFHKTHKAIQNEDGSYSALYSKDVINKNICPKCGGKKTPKAKLCLNCRKKVNQKNIPSKEKLIELLQKYSKKQIGEKFNVTDRAVYKWCKKYNI